MRLIDEEYLMTALDGEIHTAEVAIEENYQYKIKKDTFWEDFLVGLNIAQTIIEDTPKVDAIPVEFLNQYTDIDSPRFEMMTAKSVVRIMEDWRAEKEKQNGTYELL